MIVLVTGCFDVIHAGHIALLEYAYNMEFPSARVIVGLNDDDSIRHLKGPDRPINSLYARFKVMTAIKFVEGVFPIASLRVDKAIREVRPNIWLKGGDYTLDSLDKIEVQAAHDVGARIEIFPTFGTYSTTGIAEKLKNIETKGFGSCSPSDTPGT